MGENASCAAIGKIHAEFSPAVIALSQKIPIIAPPWHMNCWDFISEGEYGV
jgi:hypothetical protein